jgi:hypothetical protein
MMIHARLPARSHTGFMFIELLIVLGIIGIIGTIVIVAINPTKHLCESANAKRHIIVRELGNAVNQYQIRMRRPVIESIVVGEANARPICRHGVTTDTSCVNLDMLVPEYILQIPVDPLETIANFSGYGIYRLPGGLDLTKSNHIEACE